MKGQEIQSAGPTGRWYFVITLASVGLFAAVPFFHAASRLERPELKKTGIKMAAASLAGFALIGLSPTDAKGEPTGWLSSLGAVDLMAVMLVASLLLIGIRSEVYRPAGQVVPRTGNQLAMAGVEEARKRRGEARALAIRDPMMAREVGIGRPESTRRYDDGGLLELNFATAEQLTALCGLPPHLAASVVAARESLGRFLTVEDAIVYGQVSEDHAPMVRDLGIVVADR